MDIEYLRRRQEQELARAASAECDKARIAHEQLAEFYGWEIEMAEASGGRPPRQQQQAMAG